MTRGPLLHGDMTRLRPIEARDGERLWEAVQDPEGQTTASAPSKTSIQCRARARASFR